MGEQEIDFIAENAEGKHYYQVVASVRDPQTLDCELRGLRQIHDSYPKILLILDDDPPGDYDGIQRLPGLDWLLNID